MLRTREEVRAVYDRIVLYDGVPRTRHLMDNLIVDVVDGADDASGRCYYTVLQGGEPGTPIVPILAGRYVEFLTLTGTGNGIGGTATMTLSGGSFGASTAAAYAEGFGGEGSYGYDDFSNPVQPAGNGGDGQGGTATIVIDGPIAIDTGTLAAYAGGRGGSGGDFSSIGVAVGNRLSGARALTTVNNFAEPDWRRLDALVAEWRPAALIVGFPLRLDGGEQAMSRAARAFADSIGQRYGIDVKLVDERLTSNEAARRFAGQRAAGVAKRKQANAIDAIAAEVILENWLASADA